MPSIAFHLDDSTDATLGQVARETGMSPGQLAKLVVQEYLAKREQLPIEILPALAAQTGLSSAALFVHSVLRELHAAKGEAQIPCSEICTVVGASPLTVTIHLMALRERGLVTRGYAPADRCIGEHAWLPVLDESHASRAG